MDSTLCIRRVFASGIRRENALGFQIIQDEVVRLPGMMEFNSRRARSSTVRYRVCGEHGQRRRRGLGAKIEEQRLRACQRGEC